MDECSSNNLSVVCLDVQSHKVAGALISFDFKYEPCEEFNNKYIKNNFKAFSPILSLLMQAN